MFSSRKWMMDMEVMADGTVKIHILRQKDLKSEIECATIDTGEGFHYTSGGEFGTIEFDGDIEVEDESVTFGRE